MTPAEVIVSVRELIQDEATPYRYDDDMLLRFVNQTLKRMAMLRPDIFATVAELVVTPNSAIQSAPSDSSRLMEVFSIKNGNAIIEADKETLDRSYPQWVTTTGTPKNFLRHPRNANKFFLYPVPDSAIILNIEYAKIPDDYAINGDMSVEVKDSYFPTIVDGVVFLSQSIDNEHINSGRAKLFQDSFVQSLGVELQSRAITDIEGSGLDMQQVM